jgi:hypothetical protein
MAETEIVATYLGREAAEEYAEELRAWELHPEVTGPKPGVWVVSVPADERDRAAEVRRRLLIDR